MTLEVLQEAMKQAMKTQAKFELQVIRGLIASIKKAAIDKKVEITEELVNDILIKEQKAVQEMINSCPDSRTDLLAEYEHRLAIVNAYAPKLITDEEEIKLLIKDITSDMELTKQNRGNITKLVMQTLKGKADLKVAGQALNKMLS